MKDLSSHMMDIVQNSIRAEASWIQIRICEDPEADLFLIEIQDNGCGMDEATLARVRDPFFTSRTVRKVGLGIPLLQQNAERTGGKVSIVSQPGQGTTLTARFGHSHLDRPPLGDVAETLRYWQPPIRPSISATIIRLPAVHTGSIPKRSYRCWKVYLWDIPKFFRPYKI